MKDDYRQYHKYPNNQIEQKQLEKKEYAFCISYYRLGF